MARLISCARKVRTTSRATGRSVLPHLGRGRAPLGDRVDERAGDEVDEAGGDVGDVPPDRRDEVEDVGEGDAGPEELPAGVEQERARGDEPAVVGHRDEPLGGRPLDERGVLATGREALEELVEAELEGLLVGERGGDEVVEADDLPEVAAG
jgi:hypothetical protein